MVIPCLHIIELEEIAAPATDTVARAHAHVNAVVGRMGAGFRRERTAAFTLHEVPPARAQAAQSASRM